MPVYQSENISGFHFPAAQQRPAMQMADISRGIGVRNNTIKRMIKDFM
jgi:hypothetical protein